MLNLADFCFPPEVDLYACLIWLGLLLAGLPSGGPDLGWGFKQVATTRIDHHHPDSNPHRPL